jgi:ribosome-associated translation inhibitor RaiA
MQIQVNSDQSVDATEALGARVRDVVENALTRFGDQITRVEVHLSDESSNKSTPDDKRCLLEARLEHRRPIAVSHQAATLDDAVRGAAAKMERSIESTIGRLRDEKKRRIDPPPPGTKLPDPS